MAANKADETAGDGVDPIDSDAASRADETLTGATDPAADDGYTPADEGVADQSPSESDDDAVLDVPSGDELAETDLPAPDSFEVVDDEAEELIELPEPEGDEAVQSMFADEPADQIDRNQLETAEADMAAPAARHRPVKKVPRADAPSDQAEPEPAAEESVMAGPTAPAKKNRPTRSRAEATRSDAPKKTGIRGFVGQVVQELKKVSWPTGGQLWVYFVVVLVFVLFMIAFIGLLDVFFGWIMLKMFG